MKGYSIAGYSVTCKYSRGYPDLDANLFTWNDNLTPKTDLSQIQHSGYNIMLVEAFSDSHKAFERFAKVSLSHFDLVILDLRMPGLNGLEIYNRLKSINTDVNIRKLIKSL